MMETGKGQGAEISALITKIRAVSGFWEYRYSKEERSRMREAAQAAKVRLESMTVNVSEADASEKQYIGGCLHAVGYGTQGYSEEELRGEGVLSWVAPGYAFSGYFCFPPSGRIVFVQAGLILDGRCYKLAAIS